MKQADRQAIAAVKRATEAERRARCREMAKTVPGWHRAWMDIRLRCPQCEGYLLINRWQKYPASCALRCGYQTQRHRYLSLKNIAVEHHLLGYPFPEDVPAYFLVERAAA